MFQARALEATAATNCVTEFILEASKWAEELESTPEEERGPLHGLPISIKECLHIKVALFGEGNNFYFMQLFDLRPSSA